MDVSDFFFFVPARRERGEVSEEVAAGRRFVIENRGRGGEGFPRRSRGRRRGKCLWGGEGGAKY